MFEHQSQSSFIMIITPYKTYEATHTKSVATSQALSTSHALAAATGDLR